MDVLGIPVVLQTVLGNMETRYVAVYRLVNKAWNYEACKVLRERVIITFNKHDDLRKYNEDFEGPTSKSTDISIRFKSFYFPSKLFIKAARDAAFGYLRTLLQDIRKFAQVCGDQVVSLQLCVFPLLPVEGNINLPQQLQIKSILYTEMVEMVYDYFPNLQRLKLLFLVSNPLLPELIGKKNDDDDGDFQSKLDSHFGKRLPNLHTIYIDIHASAYGLLGNNQEDVDGYGNWEMDNAGRSRGPENKMICNFIKTLLSSAPKLQIISANPPSLIECEPVLHTFLLQVLPLISPSTYLNQINIRLKITPEHMQTLCTYDFPNLGTLFLEIDSNTVTNSDLKEFFAHYCHSLKKLDLNFSEPSQSDYFTQLPMGVPMKKLKTITLHGYQGCFDWGKLPALKQLALNRCSLSGFSSSLISYNLQRHMSNCTCAPKHDNLFMCSPTSLEILKISKDLTETTESFVKEFQAVAPYCFPHLTSMIVAKLPKTLFPTIFQECKQLKRLVIENCLGVNDEILCGIRKSLLSKICPVEPMDNSDNLESVQKLVAFARNPSQATFRESPFIGNLKGLQTLILEGEFTDVTVLYGIIHCERLVELKLSSRVCTWRTTRIIKVAFQDIVNASVKEPVIF